MLLTLGSLYRQLGSCRRPNNCSIKRAPHSPKRHRILPAACAPGLPTPRRCVSAAIWKNPNRRLHRRSRSSCLPICIPCTGRARLSARKAGSLRGHDCRRTCRAGDRPRARKPGPWRPGTRPADRSLRLGTTGEIRCRREDIRASTCRRACRLRARGYARRLDAQRLRSGTHGEGSYKRG